MNRRSLALCVGLAVTITPRVIPITAQQSAAPQNADKALQPNSSQPPTPAARPQGQEQQRPGKDQPNSSSILNPAPGTAAPPKTDGNDGKGAPSGADSNQSAPHDWWTIGPSITQALAAIASTGITVAIFFIYRGQLRVMRRQATVMRLTLRANRKTIDKMDEIAKQSADSLKIVHRQWVDVGKYELVIDAAGPSFSFQFRNNTTRPITLMRIIVLSSKAGDGLDQWGLDQILTPQDSYAEVLDLTKADAAGLFAAGERVEIDIVGAIYFNDSFGDPQRQLFGRHLVRQSTGKRIVRPIAGGLRHHWLHLLKLHPDVTPPPDKHEGKQGQPEDQP